MTTPGFSAPVPRQIGLGVEELISQAKRLGLLQTYRPATITDVPTEFSSFANFLAILDGDDAPIPVQSLVGGLVVGTRVMVMTVPPQGVYVIGFFGLEGMESVRPVQSFFMVGATEIPAVPGAVWYDFECQAGGGAGGGATAAGAGANSKGGGGAGGNYSRSIFAASELSFPLSCVVGAGGTSVSGASGNNGGLTSIGSGPLVLANGGGGGSSNASNTAPGFSAPGGAAGVLGTAGQIQIRGGGGGIGTGSATLCGSGAGGNSFLGGGASGRASGGGGASQSGLAGGQWGGGGSGAAVNAGGGAQGGGTGADGIIIVTAHFH